MEKIDNNTNMDKKRIGLIFGSFDPPHIGHIQMAIQAINKNMCDEVRLVPAKGNPWKRNQTDYDIRLEMVEAATKDIPFVTYDATESICDSHYTYNVIETIKEQAKESEQLIILTTPETLEEMPMWQNGDKVLLENQIAVMEMPLPVHSTDVRNMIKERQIPLPYIDYKVLQIIVRNKLYEEKET